MNRINSINFSQKYSEDAKGEFPNDLSRLSQLISQTLGFKSFKAEAAIVNYYYFNSSLSGHIDNSEQNLEAPLFSFSFGQSAIFLIGTDSLDGKPTPILIRSGDIVVMTKLSRLCYHGVPKILEDKSYPKWDNINLSEDFDDENNILEICVNENSWILYRNFLKKSRININVRQVLKESEKLLNGG